MYGDRPNRLPLDERDRREIRYAHSTRRHPDDMSIDNCSTAVRRSKVAADVVVQEYGRYFGMQTACFRGGCLTGPNHAGAKLHGFLAYLMKCTVTGEPYTVFGYKGKQVRDNIHSADLVRAFDAFRRARARARSTTSAVAEDNCSMLEAITLCEQIAGRELDWRSGRQPRRRPHVVDQRPRPVL